MSVQSHQWCLTPSGRHFTIRSLISSSLLGFDTSKVPCTKEFLTCSVRHEASSLENQVLTGCSLQHCYRFTDSSKSHHASLGWRTWMSRHWLSSTKLLVQYNNLHFPVPRTAIKTTEDNQTTRSKSTGRMVSFIPSCRAKTSQVLVRCAFGPIASEIKVIQMITQ